MSNVSYKGLDGRTIFEDGSVVIMHEGMAARVAEKIDTPPIDLLEIKNSSESQVTFSINYKGHIREFSFGEGSGAFELFGSNKNPLKSSTVSSLMQESPTIERFAQVALKPAMYASPNAFLEKLKNLSKSVGLTK